MGTSAHEEKIISSTHEEKKQITTSIHNSAPELVSQMRVIGWDMEPGEAGEAGIHHLSRRKMGTSKMHP